MRKFVVVVLLLSLLLFLPLASQSSSIESDSLLSLPAFDNSFEYKVAGSLLNKWLEESKAQQQALLSADARCEEALKLANASLTSFETYKRNIAQERALEVTVAVIVALTIGCALGTSK